MGYTFNSSSLDNQIKDIRENYEQSGFTVIDCARTNYGRHFWTLTQRQEVNDGYPIVTLHKFEKYDGRWGSKDIDERSYPYYFDCPTRLLKYPSNPNKTGAHKGANEWREEVRKYWKARKENK